MQICLFISFEYWKSLNHMKFWYSQSPRSVVGVILLHRSGNLSLDLTSCCFDRLNLISMIGTNNVTKWPGKVSFQNNFTLEQQLLLLHLRFLEVQKNEVSHRKHIDVCNIFCVWICTDLSFQSIPNLSSCIRHFHNFSLVFWTFLTTYGRRKWMAVKPKIILLTINRYQIRARWKVVGRNIEV